MACLADEEVREKAPPAADAEYLGLGRGSRLPGRIRQGDRATVARLSGGEGHGHRCPRWDPGSGRVGRSAGGRALDPDAVTLAVVASVRHSDTGYDRLLMSGIPRAQAREQVRSEIQRVLDVWRATDGDGGSTAGLSHLIPSLSSDIICDVALVHRTGAGG